MAYASGPGVSDEHVFSSLARRAVIGGALLALVAARTASGAFHYDFKKAFPNTGAGGHAGYALAIMGSRIVVGAPGQSRVDVYDRLDQNPVPIPLQTIVSPNASPGDNFGAAVAAVGTSKLLVGAPGENTPEGGAGAGAAYLFDLATPTPTMLKRFVRPPTAPPPAAGAAFGSALAVGPSFVISATGDDAEATDSGAVYTFATSGTYDPQQRIPNPTSAANDDFGSSPIVYAKGSPYFPVYYYAIGAYNDDGAKGAVYEFQAGTTTPVATFTGTVPSWFGFSIALGPTAANGHLTFLVGAPSINAAFGQAYLVDETNGAILKTFNRPSGGAIFDLFGWAVANLNSNLVVSAPGVDAGQSNAGQVYVFENNPNTLYPLLDTLSNPTPGADDLFGFAVAGTNRLAVGARDDDTAAVDAGAAYLFEPTFPTTCWTSGAPAAVGQWDPPRSWPLVAVHMVLLNTPDHNGKVLFWQGFGGPSSYLWDPVTLQVTDVGTIPSIDPFCAGHATLKDGRALVIGGTFGNSNAEVFDGTTQLWASKANMHFNRFYPTTTALGKGRVLAVEGTDANQHQTTPEVYDPALDCWRNLVPTNNPPIVMETYPFMFLLPDGKLFQAGRSVTPGGSATPVTRKLTLSIPDAPCTTDGSSTWAIVSNNPNDIDGDDGSAVLYRAGEQSGQDVVVASKVMKAGGLVPTTTGCPGDPTAQACATSIAEKIDVQQTTAWTQVASMQAARAHVNLVILPTGKVIAVGGTSGGADGGFSGVQLGAEVWDPNAAPQPQGTWTKLACMSEPRMYHSTALLLPDGSVLSAGGGPLVDGGRTTVYPSYQVFRPPYMFASRPGIVASSVPAEAQFFSSFDLTLTNATASEITSVAFIRPGAVTHSFDQNQRYVPTQFRVKDATTLTVSTPVNNKYAPAGYYMLFVVKGDVPSTGVFIRLEGGGCGSE